MTFPRSYRHCFSPAPLIVHELLIGMHVSKLASTRLATCRPRGEGPRAEPPDLLAVERGCLDRIDDRADFQPAAQFDAVVERLAFAPHRRAEFEARRGRQMFSRGRHELLLIGKLLHHFLQRGDALFLLPLLQQAESEPILGLGGDGLRFLGLGDRLP